MRYEGTLYFQVFWNWMDLVRGPHAGHRMTV
jgi:hypothetical protein